MQDEHVSTVPRDEHADLVKDARYLLNFALSEWPAVLKRGSLPPAELGDSIIKPISVAEEVLNQGNQLTLDQRIALEAAYLDLGQLLAPINVQTLRSTSDEYARAHQNRKISRARIWTMRMWVWTGLFAILAVAMAVFEKLVPQAGGTRWIVLVNPLIEYSLPFTYGAIGAGAYLLRSAVIHIAAREFDPIFIPQWRTRLTLGTIMGGIAYFILTKTPLSSVGGGVDSINIAPGLFGFLAGYFNERLFMTLQRLADAVFPGITLQVSETVEAKRPQVPVRAVPVERLVEELKETSDPEVKKVIISLLDRVAK